MLTKVKYREKSMYYIIEKADIKKAKLKFI